MPKLLPLLSSTDSTRTDIIDLNAWQLKQAEIRSVLTALVGNPTNLQKPAQEAIESNQFEAADHFRHHLSIRSETDDWIPAYFLIPKSPSVQRLPTVIVLHQTVPQGKDEPCGITNRAKPYPDMTFALELVARGYACLVPDTVGFGERNPTSDNPYVGALDFFRRHPHWSYFGKMNWDIQRMVDYLETRPEVDPKRIALVGHSHGAYGSIMGAIFEPRVAAVLASCGFTTLRADPHPERWSDMTALMPRLGYYTSNIKTAPLDWHEILSLLAPRPFYYWGTLQDSNFQHTENLTEIFAQLAKVYALYGNPAPKLDLRDGPHGFPKPARERAWNWLDQTLRNAR